MLPQEEGGEDEGLGPGRGPGEGEGLGPGRGRERVEKVYLPIEREMSLRHVEK